MTLQYLTMEQLLRQCRLESDADQTTQSELTDCGATAETMVILETRRTAEELQEMGGGSMPNPVIMAMLMLAEHLFRNKGLTVTQAVNTVQYGYEFLIHPYVKLSDRPDEDSDD